MSDNFEFLGEPAGFGTVPDADATTKGKVQLAGDLGGTAAAPTVPGLVTLAASAKAFAIAMGVAL